LISFFRLFLLAESPSSDKVGSSELKLMSGRSYVLCEDFYSAGETRTLQSVWLCREEKKGRYL